MGRHSAPDSDEELPAPEPAASEAAEPPQSQTAPALAPHAQPVPGARGDLKLLRGDVGLRLRCAGAVVLIFLVYTSVLIPMGRTDVYLIWVWIPTVLSGAVVGGLLDRAHGARAGDHR